MKADFKTIKKSVALPEGFTSVETGLPILKLRVTCFMSNGTSFIGWRYHNVMRSGWYIYYDPDLRANLDWGGVHLLGWKFIEHE